MKISPMRPVASTFRGPNPSEFPFRSGMASVVESTTWTNPGGSPLGDASSRPSASHVATTMKGERSMNSWAVSSISVRSLILTRSSGEPMSAIRSSSVVTACGSERCVRAIPQACHHLVTRSARRTPAESDRPAPTRPPMRLERLTPHPKSRWATPGNGPSASLDSHAGDQRTGREPSRFLDAPSGGRESARSIGQQRRSAPECRRERLSGGRRVEVRLGPAHSGRTPPLGRQRPPAAATISSATRQYASAP